jgi:hypothetical protein
MMAGDVNRAVRCRTLEVHHQQFRSHSGEDSESNLITLYPDVMGRGTLRT